MFAHHQCAWRDFSFAVVVEADLQVRLANTRRKKTYKEEREYEALPARIEALEDEQRRLQEESHSPEFYKSGAGHISQVLARIDEIHAALEDALARWLELESIQP